MSKQRENVLAEAIRTLIIRAGEEPSGHHVRETPERFLAAWDFWTSGYQKDPAAILKTFPQPDVDSLVFQANIPVWSLCAHHLAPFWGLVHIGYLPKDRIVGLSKLARLVDVFARRLQTQEQLGCQIVDALMQHLDCLGAGVVIQCRHACMESRGVQKAGTLTITSALRGGIKDEPACRTEFLNFVNVATQGAKLV